MALVYVLAAIGLIALLGLAALAVVLALEGPDRPEDVSDPYAEGLAAVARLHAGAWQAIQELRGLEPPEER